MNDQASDPTIEEQIETYILKTGVTPTRFILVVHYIHARRVAELNAAGFEVVQPEEE